MRMIRKALMLGVVIAGITTCACAEDLYVPSDLDGSVETSAPLILNQWYVIKAQGTYDYKIADAGKYADAEWVRTEIAGQWVWVETPTGGDLDLYVNGADISMMGTTDGKNFSPHVYSDSHNYRANILGTDEPVRFSIFDKNKSDNSGTLHVIIELGQQDVTIVHQMGDTNLNGVIDGYDYGNLVAQFGGPPGDESADFNGDGVVDLYDFTILRENFNLGSASAPTVESGATAPEPATMILMVSALPLLLKRRRLGLAVWASQARKSC